MNFYELIIIVRSENIYRIKKIIYTIRKILNNGNSLLLIAEEWGFRNFSYLINNYSKGYYIYLNIKLNSKTYNKIIYYLKFTIDILRFLFINLKKKIIFISFFILKKIKLKIEKKKINKNKFFKKPNNFIISKKNNKLIKLKKNNKFLKKNIFYKR